jgi:hypothetical protein
VPSDFCAIPYRKKKTSAYEVFGGIPEGKRQLEDLGEDVRIILSWTVINTAGDRGFDLSSSG